MLPIVPIAPIAPAAIPEIVPALGGSGPPGEFRNLLENSIQKVETTGNQASQAIGKFLNGETEELHTVALAAQRADISMQLFLQVRNKVVAAYQEIMRMQM
jgi:flagellar hook-basal body complex protein FliE